MRTNLIRIVSLFDGISCGQLALHRAGIHNFEYLSSEVDFHAVSITQHHFPSTIQLGDVRGIDGTKIPDVFLLMGGSPCQGFSYAGKRLNFDDPRSALFFEFVRIKNECKPKWFLLENVKMRKECQDIISSHMGVAPITINSSLVSAQNRVRLYWTNIPVTSNPNDRGVFLKDVLEDSSSFVCASRGRCIVDGKRKDSIPLGRKMEQQLEIRTDGKSNCITSVEKDNFVVCTSHKSKLGLKYAGAIHVGNKKWLENGKNLQRNFSQGYRVYDSSGKCPTLASRSGGRSGACNAFITDDNITYRKLSIIEAERLQTIPDNYTSLAPKSVRQKLIGNAWTVDVISHIFSFIPF